MGNKSYFNKNDLEPETVEGDVTRYIYTADHMQIVEYHFPPGKIFPPHSHDVHEQMGYLVKGKMGFNINGVEKILLPGAVKQNSEMFERVIKSNNEENIRSFEMTISISFLYTYMYRIYEFTN